MLLMGFFQHAQQAGHTHRSATHHGIVECHGFAFQPKQTLRGLSRGGFASVKDLQMVFVVVQQKSTTPDAAGLRLHQGQHHLHRDGSVHRCATSLQHLVARIAGQRVGGGHAALLKRPARFGLVAAGCLGEIGDAVIQLGLRCGSEQAQRECESPYCVWHLLGRQANRTIKADDLTIEHVVVQNVHHQFGVIHGRA